MRIQAKAFFYACMQLALDEEIQKHGIIVLTSVADRKKSMTDLVSVTLCTRIVRSCPIRVCVLHVLMKKSSPLMQNAVPYLRFIRNAEGVSRIRFHHGKNEEYINLHGTVQIGSAIVLARLKLNALFLWPLIFPPLF